MECSISCCYSLISSSIELSVFTIVPKYLNEFTCSNCTSPVFMQVGWIVFLVQYKCLLLLLLLTINLAFSTSYLSLQKVSIKICFVLPIIKMSSAQVQVCFNLVVIFPQTSKLVITESNATLNSRADKGSPCLDSCFLFKPFRVAVVYFHLPFGSLHCKFYQFYQFIWSIVFDSAIIYYISINCVKSL